ncbi:hypothetical protein B0H63DRAFT_493066 [Podospora didyma]|uniref:Amino-acid acetyltransferase, mitochondrial n=1 Tax=Podospora didyma TaxID=330526 RepID=A0AAE0P066_9PEZI|nr:hypothetical protein B0H63DRAFT_493066 [Podospora didyma]
MSSAAENEAQTGRGQPGGAPATTTSVSPARSPYPSSAEAKHKREFLISVLESSATKRDAKAYLQTFGGSVAAGAAGPKKPPTSPVLHDGIRAVADMPLFVQGLAKENLKEADETPHVAIVKMRDPQAWGDDHLDGVAKTLTQLRDLGMLSVIVLECGAEESRAPWQGSVAAEQSNRIIQAIGRYGSPSAEIVDSSIWKMLDPPSQGAVPISSSTVFVGFDRALTTPLKHGHILVVPPRAYSDRDLGFTTANSSEVVFALTAFFSGLPIGGRPSQSGDQVNEEGRPVCRASVDRIIVIDPLGGIPGRHGHGAQVFINLEQEFDDVRNALASRTSAGIPDEKSGGEKHLENLELVKATLAILRPNASAVITSPAEAANLKEPQPGAHGADVEQFAGEVKTRRWQNPLIHNLLTNRPIYSSSLPIGRIKPNATDTEVRMPRMPTTTLATKGMPVTIFPDPRTTRWQPPQPGGPRLRLTDTCIDLPRLIHLINDSFSRKLDVEHYLCRVENSLAGIIIAGEYEGGAILTWERPVGMDEETAYRSGRLVPYLDKFAVLKKSQGAGGVADTVFNAMVRDCFPDGVCWRSRKDNPVNKWYFERSCGDQKLPDSNWTMFWTSPDASLHERLIQDYEDVCRNVVPSWADTKQAAD